MALNNKFKLEENGNAEDKYGMTPVCLAIKSGNKDLVLAYIQQGLDMNYKNSVDGVTPFIRACNTENVDMVNFLIDHVNNLDVNLTDGRGYSALHYACQYGYNDIVRLILKRTKPTLTLYTMEKALGNVNENVLKELIDLYKTQHPPSSELSSLLAKGPVSFEVLLYELGGTIDQGPEGEAIFLSACEGNSLKAVTWLLNEGEFKSKINTCIDSNGRTGLLLAVLNHAESVVELLLANGANPHTRDYSNRDAIECANSSYDDGADYLRLRDPPEVVNRIIQLLNKHENHQK